MTPCFQDWPLKCGRCNHEWTGHVAVQCAISISVASMKAIVREGCPACFYAGRDAVLVNLAPPSGPVPGAGVP